MPLFQLRVTTDEREAIHAAAKAAGLTASDYVRNLVPELGGRTPSAPERVPPVAPPPIEKPRDPKPSAFSKIPTMAEIRLQRAKAQHR